MAGKMLDDSCEFVVNWDDGKNIQVEFVASHMLTMETVILTPKQIDRLKKISRDKR